ncbi:helix-turn-helix domain-containing protein (plasmid) [Kribbella sp. CWNU-51]
MNGERAEDLMSAGLEPDPLWDIDQLSGYLNIPKRTLYRWRTLKYGPQGIRVGRYVRYRRSVVLDWIDEQQHRDGE